jgi:endoglucanase
MDEIGLMAIFAEPKSGYLRFSEIGGVLRTTLLGSRVKFENGVTGVVGVHDLWSTHIPPTEQYYIDISDGETANGSHPLVMPGSPATFVRPLEERGSRLIGKAMDDRIGCVVAIEAMRRLKASGTKSPNELYFVFAVQEEVGLRGAGAAAFSIEPDVAIALDVTPTGDVPKSDKLGVKLGGGAAIKIHDTGHVVPPAVRDWMIARAEANGIPHQLELLTLGTTDAARIQTARAGVPSGCISIPCRFVHTTSETVDLGDVQACIDLLVGLLENPVTLT